MEHLDRRTLEHYAKGHVVGADAHHVELHLERCPLCRDAVDGLRDVAAVVPDLKNPYTGDGSTWLKGPLVVAGCALLVFVPWLMNSTDDVLLAVSRPDVPDARTAAPEEGGAAVRALDLPTAHEIHVAVPIAPMEQIGHEPEEMRPVIKEEEVVVLRDSIPVREVRFTPPAPRPDDSTHVPTPPRDSRQLVFLHNLKLVHPDELYGDDPPSISELGVSARFADKAEQDAAEPETSPVQYMDHLDGAMAAFARNDHKAALTDLRIVLSQYPDDVNALFYAGLSCYNLGLFRKAQRYFERTADHAITTFDQEARWYLALSTERVDGRATAAPLYEAIAKGRGFYAQQALEQLR